MPLVLCQCGQPTHPQLSYCLPCYFNVAVEAPGGDYTKTSDGSIILYDGEELDMGLSQEGIAHDAVMEIFHQLLSKREQRKAWKASLREGLDKNDGSKDYYIRVIDNWKKRGIRW